MTNLVRRIYLESIAIKPQIRLSAALIAFGGGPTTEAAWTSAEAYWRVYQDWRAWTEEGILDLAIPMNYKREHIPSQVTMYDTWNEWTKDHAYNRAVLIGPAVYLNAVEGTLRQVRRALAPSAAGNLGSGVVFYSMANTNVAVSANPFSLPPGQNTPLRPFVDFAAGLKTGRSASGSELYEDPLAYPEGVFAFPVPQPVFTWKAMPQVGHLKGVARDTDSSVIDTGEVMLTRVAGSMPPAAGRTTAATATDGNGFFGGVDLAPGRFQVTIMPPGQPAYVHACTAEVLAGQVTTFDFTVDRAVPASTLTADPMVIWPPNGGMVPVTLTGDASDEGTGLASISFRVIDEYGRVEPAIETIALDGRASFGWSRTVELEARRLGSDRDGRRYTIEVTVADRACNTRTVAVDVVVPHDMRR